MREKKFLHTKRSMYCGSSSKYSTFTNDEPQTDEAVSPITEIPMQCILDVRKLPKNVSSIKWQEFYTNGRPDSHDNGILLCSVLMNDPPIYFWKKNVDCFLFAKGYINKIREMETSMNTSARNIEMYLSYSPCEHCVADIIQFLEARISCKLSLYFSSLYKPEEREKRCCLRRLNKYPGVKEMRIFTAKEWKDVAAKCGVDFEANDRFRDYFDHYWKKELDHILSVENEWSSNKPWTSLQLTPRLQYYQDIGAIPMVNFNTEVEVVEGLESSRRKRFTAAVDPRNNKMSSAAAVIVIIVIIIFIVAIVCGWRSTEESSEQFQNMTQGQVSTSEK